MICLDIVAAFLEMTHDDRTYNGCMLFMSKKMDSCITCHGSEGWQVLRDNGFPWPSFYRAVSSVCGLQSKMLSIWEAFWIAPSRDPKYVQIHGNMVNGANPSSKHRKEACQQQFFGLSNATSRFTAFGRPSLRFSKPCEKSSQKSRDFVGFVGPYEVWMVRFV